MTQDRLDYTIEVKEEVKKMKKMKKLFIKDLEVRRSFSPLPITIQVAGVEGELLAKGKLRKKVFIHRRLPG